jgi:hypothetical protein
MNGGHRRDPVLAFQENPFHLLIFDIVGLELEEAGDDLQIVLPNLCSRGPIKFCSYSQPQFLNDIGFFHIGAGTQ